MQFLSLMLIAGMGCASIGHQASPRASARRDVAERITPGARPSAQPSFIEPSATRRTRSGLLGSMAPHLEELAPRRGSTPDLAEVTEDNARVAAGNPKQEVWTDERWNTVLRRLLPSRRLADAAMWMGHGPLSVQVSGGGLLVSVRVATP